MRKIIWIIVSFCLLISFLTLYSCSDGVSLGYVNHERVPMGKIERLEFAYPIVGKRIIDVWLPEGYPDDAPYNVLYANDGEALFGLAEPDVFNADEWKLDETLSQLMNRNVIPPTIVVGIHNLGKYRTQEYFPEKAMKWIDTISLHKIIPASLHKSIDDNFETKADEYLHFIVDKVKPYVESHYRVNGAKGNTFMIGSSMGGLISMYALCEYPEIFAGVACLSTHFVGLMEHNMIIPEAILKYMNENLPSPNIEGCKFYFDYGDQGLDSLYAPYQIKVDEMMKSKGYKKELWQTYFFKGEGHSPVSWSKRLSLPLRFLMEKN